MCVHPRQCNGPAYRSAILAPKVDGDMLRVTPEEEAMPFVCFEHSDKFELQTLPHILHHRSRSGPKSTRRSVSKVPNQTLLFTWGNAGTSQSIRPFFNTNFCFRGCRWRCGYVFCGTLLSFLLPKGRGVIFSLY